MWSNFIIFDNTGSGQWLRGKLSASDLSQHDRSVLPAGARHNLDLSDIVVLYTKFSKYVGMWGEHKCIIFGDNAKSF